MKSLAAKILTALAAACLPALMVAGILGFTLISTVSQVESDFEKALSAVLHTGDIRTMMEKEYGLVARLPAELDQSKVDAFAAQISELDRKLDQAIDGLAGNTRIAAPETISQLRIIRLDLAKTTGDILKATRSFAQTTALELVNGPFEANVGVAVTLLDAIASNAAAVADAARRHLNDSSSW